VGSVVCNAALIFGLGCSLAALPGERFVLRRQGSWMLFAAVVLCGFCYAAYWADPAGPVLPRWVGVVLLALLAVYVVMSVVWSRQHPRGEPFVAPEAAAEPEPTPEEQRR